MAEARRLTGRQIVTMVAMLSFAIVLAPVGAVAATSMFTISDPTHSSYKAHVSSKGGLAVTAQDGTTGVRAKVDKSGHAVVGDGRGPLTVDGKVQVGGSVSVSGGSVNVNGSSVRSYAPGATWHFTTEYSATYYDLTAPRTDAVNVTSLFVGGDSSTQFIYVAIYAATTPSSATTTCSASASSSQMLWQGEVGGSAGATIPVSAAFPTPLQARPAAGKKICLYAYVNHSGGALVNASGYFGG